jgi:hypothetical protein
VLEAMRRKRDHAIAHSTPDTCGNITAGEWCAHGCACSAIGKHGRCAVTSPPTHVQYGTIISQTRHSASKPEPLAHVDSQGDNEGSHGVKLYRAISPGSPASTSK